MQDRTKELRTVTTRILIIAIIAVTMIASIPFLIKVPGNMVGMFTLTWDCGVLGGAVSLQQRLRVMEAGELRLLSSSWPALLMVPLIGGIFALLLSVLFISRILNVSIFPVFSDLQYVRDAKEDLMSFVFNLGPASPQDTAKLFFWSFVAGFSERFVPQVIQSVSSKAKVDGERLGDVSAGKLEQVQQPSKDVTLGQPEKAQKAEKFDTAGRPDTSGN